MIIKNSQSKEVTICKTPGEAIALLMDQLSDSDMEAEDFLNVIEIVEASLEEAAYIRNEVLELWDENCI